ncbi:hypothetical protein T484DRAFT_1929286 [Baffinella frigidus]|nr:hypothetical protein T484DRAFT_1929286 [Cryptophyta sp. CCMP2293]
MAIFGVGYLGRWFWLSPAVVLGRGALSGARDTVAASTRYVPPPALPIRAPVAKLVRETPCNRKVQGPERDTVAASATRYVPL